MIAELDNIANKDKHYSSTRDNNVLPDIRETTASVEEEFIIGRTEEKQEILSILSGSTTKKMAILPIYGIGGIGKTTLAQLVFNDTQFQGYSRVWVHVSQEFDMKKIGNSIISQLANEISLIANKQILHNRLRELFVDKSFLIVLDDLWEMDTHKLDELEAMLRLGQGSKVIVITTRDKNIAKNFCGPVVTPYKLEVLTDDMCWTIIKQKSFFEDRDDKEQLEQIGRQIAIKCAGVALAAQTLGYMLRNMNSDQWESVKDNCIWNLSTRNDPSSGLHKVLASLLLSYTHMPDWLKLCFSYCAVFPKGHHIAKCDLIHQWIALGFTEQSSIFDSIQLCEIYVTQLLGMSFLQYSKTKPPKYRRWGKGVPFFIMHDLVHDLASTLLAHQLNNMGNAGGGICRYALLTDCSKPLQLSMTSLSNLKALHFLDCNELQLHGDAISLVAGLHVLDLTECLIQKLPDSIGQLRHLRYLCAPYIHDQMIPNCVTQFSELNYLNLRGSANISSLPESIGDMKGLMHLDLSYCSGLRELPVSFAELKQLVHLNLSHCNVSISEAFGGFTKLQYLNLSIGDGSFKVPKRGLLEFIVNLKKLRYLNLTRCMVRMRTSQIGSLLDSISTLSNLEHLVLSWNVDMSSIPESIGNLTKLHTLDLLGCCNLVKLPNSMVNMVSLKALNVGYQARFDFCELSVPNFDSLPYFVVHASSDKSCSNIRLLKPTNPVELVIDRLENVKSPEEAQSIKLIEKQNNLKLTFKWTVDAWRYVDDKEVLEKLVPPSSVQILYISGYRNVSLPDWLGTSQYLPNLSRLALRFFRNCKNLPSLGQLPNLRELTLAYMDSLEEWNTAYTSGEEGANELLFPKLEKLRIFECAKLRRWFVGHYSVFPELKELSIDKCAKLRLWLVGHYSVFPKLQRLYILDCAKLRIEPCMPRTEFLCVRGCDNVLSSWGESSSDSGALSSSPISLRVQHSKVPLHQWRLLHHLPALRTLIIDDCSDLTISPDIIKKLFSLKLLMLENQQEAELPRWVVELTSLPELVLCWFESMTSLPQWLGELASLKKLTINYCKEIMSLPDSIQQLTNLEHLYIDGCPALVKWFELEENKMKLAHLKVVKFRPHGPGGRTIRYSAVL